MSAWRLDLEIPVNERWYWRTRYVGSRIGALVALWTALTFPVKDLRPRAWRITSEAS